MFKGSIYRRRYDGTYRLEIFAYQDGLYTIRVYKNNCWVDTRKSWDLSIPALNQIIHDILN